MHALQETAAWGLRNEWQMQLLESSCHVHHIHERARTMARILRQHLFRRRHGVESILWGYDGVRGGSGVCRSVGVEVVLGTDIRNKDFNQTM